MFMSDTINECKKVRGVPFKKGDDPRRNPCPPGRPPNIKTIPDLLRWSGSLDAPDALVAKMRAIFKIPDDQPLTVEEAIILRSRMEAMNGSIQHIVWQADREEGKVSERLEVKGSSSIDFDSIVASLKASGGE